MARAGARIRRCAVRLALLLPLAGVFAQDQPARGFTGPFRVSGILVEGNRITREAIILRELTFREQDTLAADDVYQRLQRSRENLLNLGLFNSALLMPTYLGPNEVFITITVNERWYWWPQPLLRFADPNFNTWWLTRDLGRLNFGLELYRFNLRGRNETLAAKAQFGYSKEFALSYRVPYVDRRQRWGVRVDGSYGEQDEITIGTTGNKRILLKTPTENIIRRWNAGAALALRRSHDIRHQWRIGWADVAVRDTVVLRNAEYLAPEARHVEYLSLGYSLVVDRRDSRAFPLSGSLLRLQLDRTGIGPGQPEVTALKAAGQRSWKAGERWSLGASLAGKTSAGAEDHYFLQEGLGYSDHIRGYEYYVIDGQHWLLGKANILFALLKPRTYRVEAIPVEAFRTLYVAIYLNAFADAGHVWDDAHGMDNPLANRWQGGYGLGLDLVTSYDQVLRLEGTLNALGEAGFYLHFTQPF